MTLYKRACTCTCKIQSCQIFTAHTLLSLARFPPRLFPTIFWFTFFSSYHSPPHFHRSHIDIPLAHPPTPPLPAAAVRYPTAAQQPQMHVLKP